MSSLLRINILEPKLLAGVSILAPLTMISSTLLAERSLIRKIFIENKIIINKQDTLKKISLKPHKNYSNNKHLPIRKLLSCNFLSFQRKNLAQKTIPGLGRTT
jgi:hypothetical protein